MRGSLISRFLMTRAVKARGRRSLLWAMIILIALTTSGCVYFNTFYHARKFYKEGEKAREKVGTRAGGIRAGKNQYEKAIEKASKVVEKHPKSKYHDDALFLIGMCYFHIANYTKSESAFRELLVTHPKSKLCEESRLYLARCRIELGDEQAGFRAFTELAETARKSEWRAEAIYQRGAYFFQNETYDSANQEFQRVLTEYPKSDRAIDCRLQAALALRHLGRYDEAIALYRPLTNDQEIAEVHFQALQGIGESFYESGNPDSGVALFAALVEDERHEDSIGTIRLALARGLQEIGDYDGAWRQYQQVVAALERTAWSAEAYFRMGEIKQFREEDLTAAKELYDQSRLERATGELAQEALTRSANITKLEQFRKELGRGALESPSRSGGVRSDEPYDPSRLPRLEREVTYSPLEARPPDYLSAGAPLDSTELILGPPTPADLVLGPPTPADYAAAEPLPPTPDTASESAEVYGPPTELAPFLGPPVDSADIAFNKKRSVLLPVSNWLSLIGVDSAQGPASPAYLYEFGTGDLLGPATPDDSVLYRWAVADVDTAAERIKAEREVARASRQAELEKIKGSANTQLQLAELYRFSLANPDSAVVEYDNMVKRYPNTPYAAKALLGAADVLMDDLQDTAAAYERLHRILREYPYSDYAGEAIARLGLEGTDADTAHPVLAYRKAEEVYLLEDDPERAIAALEEFIQRYPDSRLVANAEFAIVALTEMYFPKEDSSVLLAYKEIEANYPNTPFAEAATQKLTFTVPRPQRRRRAATPSAEELAQADGDTAAAAGADSARAEPSLPKAPKPKVQGQFVYPEFEVGSRSWKGVIVYKILIDFTGQIADYEPLNESPSTDINEAARLAVEQTSFFADSIPPESLNIYYRYEIQVTPPALKRDEFDRFGIPVNPTDRQKP